MFVDGTDGSRASSVCSAGKVQFSRAQMRPCQLAETQIVRLVFGSSRKPDEKAEPGATLPNCVSTAGQIGSGQWFVTVNGNSSGAADGDDDGVDGGDDGV